VLRASHPAEAIQFAPPLPADKREALERLCVRGALKVVAKFSRRFWPADMHGAICSDAPVPEFWARDAGAWVGANGEPRPAGQQPARDYHVLCGYATAGFHANLTCFSEQQIVDTFVAQLDHIFADERGDAAPASAAFLGGMVFDWAKVPYIRGAYSCPSVHERVGDRALYARAEADGRITFAGEGSDFTDAYMTMHSAMRTGWRAAAEMDLLLPVAGTSSRLL
jgi:monoamine oxidase